MYHDQRQPIDVSMMEEDTIKELQEIGELPKTEREMVMGNPSPVVEEKTLDEKKKEAEDIAKAKMENDEVLEDAEYDWLPF